jgi:hypothetical protein
MRPQRRLGRPRDEDREGQARPNELTAAEAAALESRFQAAYAQSATAGVRASKKITIPVVWHIVSEDGTRATGNVARSMIDAQMNVLNQAFGGYTGGAASRFEFKTRDINPRWALC